MFRRYVEPCKSSAVHGPHKRWNRDLDRIQCWGILKDAVTDPWRAANPSLGMDVIKQFDYDKISMIPHRRHEYKLANTLITERGTPVGNHNIYWQCSVPMCWRVYFANRQAFYEELTRKQVEQTWPG